MDIFKYKKAEDFALATAKKLEAEAFKLPEPPPLMSAKAYKTKYAEPFIKKLIKIVKDLVRRCFRAEKSEKQFASEIARLTDENSKLKSRVWVILNLCLFRNIELSISATLRSLWLS